MNIYHSSKVDLVLDSKQLNQSLFGIREAFKSMVVVAVLSASFHCPNHHSTVFIHIPAWRRLTGRMFGRSSPTKLGWKTLEPLDGGC